MSTTDDFGVFWIETASTSSPENISLGGKGRWLARLAAAGLAVPTGFILPAEAFPAHPPSVPDQSIPEATAGKLAAAYAELGRRLGEENPLVAVRSSGLAEDLQEASFAGQYVTVLGVRGAQEVVAAAARCQASLWAPGVAAYREAIEQRTGQRLPAPGMAVIVQALVPAEAAGVAETSDLIGGSSETITIRAAWGLGRSVVDGSVQPDTWRVRRAPLAILEMRVGDKATQAGTGLDAQPEPVAETQRRQACLSFEQACEIAALAIQAEAVVGCPADVEWALAGGKIWLLQARPLTGLPANPAAQAGETPETPGPSGPTSAFPFTWPDSSAPTRHWRQKADDARVFEALQPFELDARAIDVRSMAQAAYLAGAPQMAYCLEVNGYLYYSEAPAPGDESERKLRAEAFLRPMRALHARGETLFNAAVLPEVRAETKRLASIDVEALTPNELAGYFEDMLQWYQRSWTLHMTMDNWDEFSPVGRCARLYSELTGEQNPWAIYAPFGHAPQKDHEGVDGLIELARMVKGSPALLAIFQGEDPAEILPKLKSIKDPQEREASAEFLRRLESFLDDFGLQSGSSQGIMRSQIMPGWREDPSLVIALIQRYLPQNLEALAEARRRSGEQYAFEVAQLHQKVASSGATPEQIAQFDTWFAAAARMIGGVLNHNYFLDSPRNALMHRALMACGRRMVAAGAIDEAADILWLRAHQIPAVVRSLATEKRPDWSQLVTGQKALHAWQRSLTPPATLGAPPPAPEASPAVQPGQKEELPPDLLLRGEPAVPGLVTGRVRLVDYHSLVPDIQPGDIFVAPDCGVLWASLLPVAAAVVLEGSNPGEHAMRVCREFGVPGIVQARDATRLLKEGQRVTIDGAKGWVLAPRG